MRIAKEYDAPSNIDVFRNNLEEGGHIMIKKPYGRKGYQRYVGIIEKKYTHHFLCKYDNGYKESFVYADLFVLPFKLY